MSTEGNPRSTQFIASVLAAVKQIKKQNIYAPLLF